ncbi:MAG TPA: lysophospholipid acyltransferase family protein [Myxococcaceae bacterium]|nr:lysophospholipid acyltransferase family protein [Myxococcaceae bacterium]
MTGQNRLGSAFAGGLVRALKLLPARARVALAAGLGRLAFRLGIRRRITLENLRAAFPELPAEARCSIAKGAYANMALAVMEGLCSDALTDAGLERAVVTENWAPMQAALDAGKGVLVATAHFGSWELVGEVIARRGVKVHAVVRPLRGALNDRMVESRRRSGMRFIPTRGTILASAKALRRGEMVAMLIDQVLPAERGVFVPFFGRPACTTPALSMAAIRTGAPVFVVMAAREGDHLRMFVEGPFPVADSGDRRRDLVDHTAKVTAVLEQYIRRYPDQWLWLHRRWKVQPLRS